MSGANDALCISINTKNHKSQSKHGTGGLEMENKQNFQFARILTLKDLSEINRVLGIIEGLSYAVQDSGVADVLVGVVERIEAVVNKGD